MSDATLCAKCGGQFGGKRIVIDGDQYHERCAIMSYSSHTQDDYARLSHEVDRLRSELAQAREALTEIADLKGKTLIRPSMGRDYDVAHQNGALNAFKQAAWIAADALSLLTPQNPEGEK